MQLNKILAFVTSIILAAALTACGGSPSPAPATPAPADNGAASTEAVENRKTEGTSGINLRLTWLGSGQNKDLLDKCLQDYTAETGIGVEVVFIPGNWAEYFTKIQTMVAGGEQLDVCNVAIEGFEMLVNTGLAAPIDDWIKENQEEYDAVANDVAPNVLQFMNFDGKQYGVPNEWNNVVTHFNTKLLAEAGLEVPSANWTKADFLTYTQALTKQLPDGTTQYGCYVPNAYFMFTAFLYNNNTSLMSEDFTQSNLLDPAVVEMFQFVRDLIYEYKVAPIPQTGDDVTQFLIDGKIAMHFAGRWPTNGYTNANFKDVAVQYLPAFKTNEVVVWGGQGEFTLKDTKHFDEAASLALYLASAPFIEEFMQAGAIPVLNSVASKTVMNLGFPENCEIFIDSAPMAKAVQAPAQYAECANLFDTVCTDIFTNQADIESTLKAADAELNLILSANK